MHRFGLVVTKFGPIELINSNHRAKPTTTTTRIGITIGTSTGTTTGITIVITITTATTIRHVPQINCKLTHRMFYRLWIVALSNCCICFVWNQIISFMRHTFLNVTEPVPVWKYAVCYSFANVVNGGEPFTTFDRFCTVTTYLQYRSSTVPVLVARTCTTYCIIKKLQDYTVRSTVFVRIETARKPRVLISSWFQSTFSSSVWPSLLSNSLTVWPFVLSQERQIFESWRQIQLD